MPQRDAPVRCRNPRTTGQFHGPESLFERIFSRPRRDYSEAGLLHEDSVQVPRLRRARPPRLLRQEPPAQRLRPSGKIITVRGRSRGRPKGGMGGGERSIFLCSCGASPSPALTLSKNCCDSFLAKSATDVAETWVLTGFRAQL